jgi:hypothetical protein
MDLENILLRKTTRQVIKKKFTQNTGGSGTIFHHQTSGRLKLIT